MTTHQQKLKTLVEHMIEDVLSEARGEGSGVFWLVTSVSERQPERLEQLASGVLTGVKGISDNKKIIMHFLGIGRNAALVMPGAQLLAGNDVYKIDYEDPDELLENNMELISRIWHKEHGTTSGRRGVMQNLSERIAEILRKDHDRTISGIGSSISGGSINLYYDVPEISSTTELAEFVRQRVLDSTNEYGMEARAKLPIAWWKRIVSQAVVLGMRTYRSEGEWVVQGDSLKIPDGSRLLVSVSKKPQDFPEEVQAVLKQGEVTGFKGITQGHIYSGPVIAAVYKYGLDKKFDVRFIDAHKFEETQLKLQMKHQYG